MVLVESLNSIDVFVTDEKDEVEVYEFIEPAVLDFEGDRYMKAMQKRKLRKYIMYATEKNMCFIAKDKDGSTVGAFVLNDFKCNTILYINISGEHWVHSGEVMNYILNVEFKGEEVYFFNSYKQFSSVTEELEAGVYKIKDKAAKMFAKLYGEI